MSTYAVNPFTGKKIEVGGHTHQTVQKILSGTGTEQEKRALYYTHLHAGNKYSNLDTSVFCATQGGYPPGTRRFPVDSEKRCRAALSYAHNAPNPMGIRTCALQKAKEHGWKCGISKPKSKGPTKPPNAYQIFKKQQLAALKQKGITGKIAVQQVNAAWKAQKGT